MLDTIDPIAVGGQTTYEVTVTNQGSIAVHDILITFELPSQVSFVSATGPTSYSISGQTITFTAVSSLATGSSIVFTVTVTANSAGDAVCTVTRTYTEFTTPITVQEGTTIYAP